MSGDIALNQLLNVFWTARLKIFAATILFGLAFYTSSFLFVNEYRSSTLLSPVAESSGSVNSLLRQYGSLANLAGIALPAEGDSKTLLAIEVMLSRDFIAEFIASRDVLPQLMAYKSWDADSNKLNYDPDIYNVNNEKWVRKVARGQSVVPSSQEAYKAFKKKLNIYHDKKTGFVTVSFDHVSPFIARQWLVWFVEDVNKKIKNQDLEESSRAIKYLEEQASKTPIADLQAIIYDLIQSQLETAMIANIRQEYVFKTIDPPFAPEKKFSPNRALFAAFGVMVGFLCSILFTVAKIEI